jgi:Rrf2 family iron-sulfur cluster assembly transcriptional regulator
VIAISRSAEYAIRALTYLARTGDEGFHLVREMAAVLGIPAPFLGKCLQPLVSRGMLVSQRGRNGGFRLAVKASDVTLFQIVDALDHLSRPRRCMLGQAECSDERACPVHEHWKGASTAMVDHLRETSLDDVVAFCDRNPESGYPAPTPRE